MKKVLLAALVLALAATTAKAQDSGWYLEGSVGFNNTKVEDDDGDAKVTSFYILPSINYMLNSDWAIGLGLGYEYSKGDELVSAGGNLAMAELKRNMFRIAPQITRIVALGNNFSYTPSLRVGFGFGKDKYDDYDVENDVTEIGIGISPLSFEFRPVDRWGISFTAGDLSYNYTKVKYDGGGDEKTNEFNFDFNLGAAVGFRYYF